MSATSWQTRSLAECGEWLSGGTPSKANADFWAGDIPWISAKSLTSFDLIGAEDKVTRAGAANGSCLIPSGSVLFLVRGMSLAREFKVGVAGRELAFNQDVKAIKPSSDVNGRYLARFLRASEQIVLAMTEESSHGTKRLPTAAIGGLRVPLPPPDEQKRIADILDKADALRAKRRAALAQLDTLTQSIFLEMFGDPVTNPKGWPRHSIADVGDVVTGNTPPRAVADYYGQGIEWIKSDNLNGAFFHATRAEESLSAAGAKVGRVVPAGSVLVTCIAGSKECIGNCAAVDREVAFNQQINAVVPRRMEFVFLLMQLRTAKRLVQEASTDGMKGLVSKSRFEAIRLISPPVELQREFSSHALRVLRLRGDYARGVITVDSLFASLQHRAFRGEL